MNEKLLDLVRELNQTFIYNFTYIEFVEEKLLEEERKIRDNPLHDVYQKFHFFGKLEFNLNLWSQDQSKPFPLKIETDNEEYNLRESTEMVKKYLSNPKDFFEELKEKLSVDGENYDIKYVDEYEEPYISLQFKNTTYRDNFISYKLKIDSLEHNIETSKKTSIINICNNFEYYISDLFVLILKHHPKILGNTKKEIQLNEILDANDLADLKNRMIDEHVMKLMYGDVDKWIKKLNEINKKIVPNIERKLIDTVSYIYLVRNLIVHNGGEINEIFKEKEKKLDYFDLGISWSNEAENIKFIDVNVSEITEYLILLGFQIVYLFYDNNENGDSKEIKLNCFENEISIEHFSEGRQTLSLKMYEFLWAQRSELSRSVEMRTAINYSMVLKEIGENYEEILNKVDFSGCSNEYTLCLCALRDDIDGVIYQFSQVKLGDSEYYDMVTWPILKEAVKTEKFIEFAKENFPENKLNYYNFSEENDVFEEEYKIFEEHNDE